MPVVKFFERLEFGRILLIFKIPFSLIMIGFSVEHLLLRKKSGCTQRFFQIT